MPDRNNQKIPNLNEIQLKTCVLHAMPPSWQSVFIQSSRSLDDLSIEDIIEYMEQQKSFNDSYQERQARKRSRRDSGDDDETRRSDRYRRHKSSRYAGKTHKHKHFRHRDSHERHSGDKYCPVHKYGTHTWEMCWSNKHGKNYRPGYTAKRSDTSSSDGFSSDDTTTRTSNRTGNGSKRYHTKEHTRGGNTHETYFRAPSKSGSISSDSSTSSSEFPSTARSNAGRTRASGEKHARSHGRRDEETPRGASLTGYGKYS